MPKLGAILSLSAAANGTGMSGGGGGGEAYVTDGLTFNIDCLNTASYPGTGTTWASTVNSANDGTITDATFDGTHMVFDGTNDYVTFPQNTNGLTQTPMTVEMWIYRTPTSANFLLGTRNKETLGDGISMWSTLSRFYVYGEETKPPTNANNFLYQETDLVAGAWIQVVFTTEGDDVADNILYINGSPVAWTNPTTYYGVGGYASPSTDSLIIGAQPDLAQDFNGKIDIVRTYNKVLTPAEVIQNFDAEKARFGL